MESEYHKQFNTKNPVLLTGKILSIRLNTQEPYVHCLVDSSSIQLFRDYRWRWINNKMITEHTGSIVYYDRLINSSSVDAKFRNKNEYDYRRQNIATKPYKASQNDYHILDNETIAIQLNKGLEVIVDRKMYDHIKAYRWTYCEIELNNRTNRFIRADVKNSKGEKIKSLYLDRYLIGCDDRTMLVRHLNGDILDCRISNMTLYMRRKIPDIKTKKLKK